MILFSEKAVNLPDELEELYSEYLREVQTSSYNAREPVVETPASASDVFLLPPIPTAE